ncbi:MAG TPA: septal ring lytic transglycosylase RlpA family protein [Thermoanaerobaculia bacterium]|jgi:rare lipoprotein A|nr:septal ring lytic transglycosylase RlpA family protein [Thermoanaerobaculia bacterium]
MAKRRYSSVNTPAPSTRRPWGLAGAALAFLLYGGMVVSEPAQTAAPPPRIAAPRTAPAVAVAPARIADHGDRGRASWYGRELQGSPTASGEPFDMHALTAAHRTLPLGSYARVKNLDNGRSVVVKINDRGPHARRRMIDLSYAAAEEIRMVGAGTARVEVEPVGR